MRPNSTGLERSRSGMLSGRSSGSWWIVSAMCLLSLTLVAVAQPPSPSNSSNAPKAPTSLENLSVEQGKLADKYTRLEQLLIRMSELEATTNPQRAALLKRAAQQSSEKLTRQQLNTLIKLLAPPAQLKRAVDEQQQVIADLKALLELLQSENRADRLKNEQARIKDYIKEVDRIIRLQQGIQGRTEGGDESKKLATDQQQIADRTGQLGKKIQETEGSPKPSDGKQEDEKSGESKEGDKSDEEKSDGKEPSKDGSNDKSDGKGKDPADSKSSDKSGKSGEKSSGDPKSPKDGKSSDQKSADQKSSDGKSPDEKSKDQKSSDQPPDEKDQKSPEDKSEQDPSGDQKSSDKKAGGKKSGGKRSDGKKSGGKKSSGQQSEGKEPSEKPDSQDQPEESQEDSQQKESIPARKELQEAEDRMRKAEQKLAEAKNQDATEEQEKAREALEKAKAELEQILRQMREEEIERTLAMLEGRFRRMLESQLKIYESTKRLDKTPVAQRTRDVDIQAGKLGFEEGKLAIDADKALLLLREEGSSVAFPETVEMMRDDMQQVAERLTAAQIDKVTQGLEEDIIQNLEELIAALQKAQQDLKEQKQNQKQQQQPMDPSQRPLVDQLAELKMIRALQLRINTRTQRYARLLENVDDPVGKANDADLHQSLTKLAELEKRVHEITRNLVLGKNE